MFRGSVIYAPSPSSPPSNPGDRAGGEIKLELRRGSASGDENILSSDKTCGPGPKKRRLYILLQTSQARYAGMLMVPRLCSQSRPFSRWRVMCDAPSAWKRTQNSISMRRTVTACMR